MAINIAPKSLDTELSELMRDLPYTTQLIPLAAICAVIGKSESHYAGNRKCNG